MAAFGALKPGFDIGAANPGGSRKKTASVKPTHAATAAMVTPGISALPVSFCRAWTT